jgi:hypothetical protein
MTDKEFETFLEQVVEAIQESGSKEAAVEKVKAIGQDKINQKAEKRKMQE